MPNLPPSDYSLPSLRDHQRKTARVPMSLRQIEVFRAIMVTGSISAAGRMLHVSQPAISRVLALTESRLGYLLFDRVKARLIATPEATRLFMEVEQIYEGIQSVNDLAVSLGEKGSGTLKLVSSATFGRRLIPCSLKHLYAKSPHAKVNFRTATFDQMVGHFLAGRAHLGISLQPSDSPSLTSIALGTASIVCIAQKGHPLGDLDIVYPDDVTRYPWIGYPADAPAGRMLSDFFGEVRHPRNTIEVHSPSSAVSCVTHGLGIALVDLWSLPAEILPYLEVKPVSVDGLTIWATYSNVDPLPLLGRRLLDAVKKVIDEEVIKL
ncbi:LysR family transcriptional regulator [Pollutimonas nitritireducens]|uniref:LysR family transcriptional regulator n=1 Tax=Pollutimonas nitritireducens TaxID=2045209 RepID=A0A2N4ULC2_9BURK|nr:LysR family transcriptional regulator [Pollutimonas nitritireducens]PLC55824.1 LysR family transcriptional regulator [Pollutimonas nitritireducens]